MQRESSCDKMKSQSEEELALLTDNNDQVIFKPQQTRNCVPDTNGRPEL